jgi:DNA polymerase III epsilon subunit-like protein
MNIIVFDVETTGLPLDWGKPSTDVDNWPRVISFAWELFDETGETISQHHHLIEPDGWQIPDKDYFMAKGESEPEAIKKAKFWIDNGFSQAESYVDGEPMINVLRMFIKDYNQADLLLAHNISFDKSVVSAELIRYKIGVKGNIPAFCTKLEGEEICKLPSQYPGKYKWPKLQELYKHLFGKEFEGDHDAGCDIQATKECYFEIMLRREYESI